MTILRTTRILASALIVLALALAGCGGEATEAGGGATTEVSGGGSAASCAFIVRFDGHDYFGAGIKGTPVQGDSLGSGTIPPCDDTGGALSPTEAESVEVASIKGVDPDVAIMLPGRTDVILVRDDAGDVSAEDLIR